MPLKVVIDSNFLLIQPQFKIDILKELENVIGRKIELIILSSVYAELDGISKSKKLRERKAALTAMKLLEPFDVINVPKQPDETVDDQIIRFAREWNYPVATNDKKLRKRLSAMNLTVIYLRQKSRLEINGVIK